MKYVNFFVFIIGMFFLICSCTKEDEKKSLYFKINPENSKILASPGGLTQNFNVESNGLWEIVNKTDQNWLRVFPNQGEKSGMVQLVVDHNYNSDLREAEFKILVNGKDWPMKFDVTQEGNNPYVFVENENDIPVIPSVGGQIKIKVHSNTEWTYEIDDIDWLKHHLNSGTSISVSASRNQGDERSTIVYILSTVGDEVLKEIPIIQSSGSKILEENFDWLKYGSVVPYETAGEKRYDTWTQEEKDKGWYSTPVESSAGQQLCYARDGFVKLGKTNFGGDIISPKLDIEGIADVKVTFKAACYIAAGGAVDDNILRVAALGAGNSSVSQFHINNIPNSRAEDEAGIINDIWDPTRAYSFTISGATSDTRIQFLGGDFELTGIGSGKNRIFLDDIIVEIIR